MPNSRTPYNSVVHIIYILVLWLHTQFHLLFRACNAIPVIIGLIFKAIMPSLQHPMLTTLAGVISELDAEPKFRMLPVCPQCLEVYSVTHDTQAAWHHEHTKLRPFLAFPHKSIEEQLGEILAIPGMEDEMDHWCLRHRIPGQWQDIFDGAVCQELWGADGQSFFCHGMSALEDGELRIRLSLGVNWFSYHRSALSPSYSSCPMSLSIVNLRPSLRRYRTSNLLLFGIISGPKEPDPDQLQFYVKMGRFGSHKHYFFWTRCWINQIAKATKQAFTKDGFRVWTDPEHRQLMNQYCTCQSKNEQAEFVRAHGMRWSELVHLPYFDMCCMIVVDPMHNLFLGLVKSHFYHVWVQLKVLRKTKELRVLHGILGQFQLPAKLGHLPSLIGEPAGGSLTADQWRILATVVSPLVIWAEYMPEMLEVTVSERQQTICKVQDDKKTAAAAARTESDVDHADVDDAQGFEDPGGIGDDDYQHNSKGHKRRRQAVQGQDNEGESEGNAPCNLRPGDLPHFLKLGHVLHTLLSETIKEDELADAERLLREYCWELVELYGPSVAGPNHHYATHTGEFVRDYGPLREFWTFLFERLNKVLKSYKTSNHMGGEIECMTTAMSRLVCQAIADLFFGSNKEDNSILYQAVNAMYRASDDDHGTVQALARDLDEARENGKLHDTKFELSPRFKKITLPLDTYFPLLQFLQQHLPQLQLYSDIALRPGPTSTKFRNLVYSFDYVIINRHRYTALSRSPSNPGSLVAVRVADARLWIGELLDIILIEQDGIGIRHFGHMRWLQHPRSIVLQSPWEQF
ncbi:hypothetical protein OE88DRAFT_1714432 [Heliocybe sulcata]|uniref:Uncharacterized protein n=1 Tax=Heliocybe sulcata TaxID=5364 RepID=A0A5C3MRH4_9AGAM|nr:hypothetical protein OE88DRAFT_1714432 [Heliocybe sulcata]